MRAVVLPWSRVFFFANVLVNSARVLARLRVCHPELLLLFATGEIIRSAAGRSIFSSSQRTRDHRGYRSPMGRGRGFALQCEILQMRGRRTARAPVTFATQRLADVRPTALRQGCVLSPSCRSTVTTTRPTALTSRSRSGGPRRGKSNNRFCRAVPRVVLLVFA